MSEYQHSKVVESAMAMLRVLQDHAEDQQIHHSDMRAGIVKYGGDPKLIQFGAKYLRDRGIRVATHKRRHKSTWYTASSNGELSLYMDRAWNEIYSQVVSLARSAEPGSAERGKAVTSAVVAGERLGIAPETVIVECAPLEMPSA